MLDFLMDMGNYEDRKVDRSYFDWGYISTCRVSDGSKPFEAAVCSDQYARATDLDNTSEMTIVEAYDDHDTAQEGHDRWVKTMTESPPEGLTDCCNAGIAEFGEALGMDWSEVRIPAPTEQSTGN